MSVALFFVSHEGIAGNMLKIAEAIMPQGTSNLDMLEVPMDMSVTRAQEQALQKIQQLDTRDGIILFTDTYGSTPGNIALHLARHCHTVLVSGINLPMILRLLNYREQDRQQLLETAVDGGHKGIGLHE